VAGGATRPDGIRFARGQSIVREYHNVFLCRFDADGRCQEFTEVYLQRRD
jgi:hypothetical protein